METQKPAALPIGKKAATQRTRDSDSDSTYDEGDEGESSDDGDHEEEEEDGVVMLLSLYCPYSTVPLFSETGNNLTFDVHPNERLTHSVKSTDIDCIVIELFADGECLLSSSLDALSLPLQR